MSELITPTEYFGFPALDNQEVKLLYQIFEEAELNEVDPVTQKIGRKVVKSDQLIHYPLVFCANDGLEFMRTQDVGINEMINFKNGVNEGYYAVFGILTWVRQHRSGLEDGDFFNQAYINGDIPTINDSILERFRIICKEDALEVSGIKGDLPKAIFQEISYSNLLNGIFSQVGRYSIMHQDYSQLLNHKPLRSLDRLIEDYADNTSNHNEAFSVGMYTGLGNAILLYALTYEESCINHAKEEVHTYWPE